MSRQVSLGEMVDAEQVIHCSGDWTSARAQFLEAEIAQLALSSSPAPQIRIDIGSVSNLDTIGAWLLTGLQRGLPGHVELAGGTEQHRRLLERVGRSGQSVVPPPKHANFLIAPFIQFGQITIGAAEDIFAANAVQGRILAALGRTLSLQAPLRFPSFVQQFEQIVLRAIPIVALIALVVGAIITQQTIMQLRVFGVTIFVVDLSAILMFREIGVLLAAIMVAGRSGSAITAEIGAMRIREEFDALQVMGVDPYQALLLPRVVALVVGLPLLAFVGSMAGLIGAAIVAKFYGDIPLDVFIDRLRGAMTTTSVAVGLIKAPFMGFLVGLLASIEGLKVEGSSESLGRRTTSSVVKSIFVVIVADGLFTLFFAAIGF